MSAAANSNLSNEKINVPDSFIAELRKLLGDRVSTSVAVREHHGNAEDYFPIAPPDAVCFANTTEEVAEVVKLCARDAIVARQDAVAALVAGSSACTIPRGLVQSEHPYMA